MAYAKRTKRRTSTYKNGSTRTTQRSSTPRRSTRGKRTGGRSSLRQARGQTIRIVIEQPAPNAGARPLYAQQPVAPDRKPRFGG